MRSHAGFKVALSRPILRCQMDEITVTPEVCLSVEGVGIVLLLFPVSAQRLQPATQATAPMGPFPL